MYRRKKKKKKKVDQLVFILYTFSVVEVEEDTVEVSNGDDDVNARRVVWFVIAE